LALVIMAGLALLSVTGCTRVASAAYVPQARNFTIATVATLTTEQTQAVPSYAPVVQKMGEDYSFSPNVITVYQGDTVNLDLRNRQPDDAHTFTLTGPYASVSQTIAPNSSQQISFKATSVGEFEFHCTVTDHLPYMYGELIVLPASMGVADQTK
jgi:plastocyanin